MSAAPRVIPDDLLRRQIEASDPVASAWVAANAGSGKTHVLAQRVIRLLLDGVNPSRILCITFTKAAAANMANRVFGELAKWTTLDDVALDRAIRAISNVRLTATVRAQARRLFATALETPGGLKVQTIHAFCTRLLQQFPFEADVAARFAVLDETSETELLNRTSMGVLLEAARAPEAPLGRALAVAISAVADQTFKDVVSEAIRKRDLVTKWLRHSGSVAAAIGELCGILGVDADDAIEQADAETVNGPLVPPPQWLKIAAALDRGSKSDRDQADLLRAAHAAADIAERATIYRSIFVTDKQEPRTRIITARLARELGDLGDRINAERDRVYALLERRNAIACRDRTAALLTIADAVISRYQAEKDRRGLLDYDDLIDKSLVLLSEKRAAWVHYKLDQGIDHVLIDEAQDTSPKQWEIIRLLTAEFFAGAGAREMRRTIFAVGDEKQSIFSFQGAAPREFDEMRRAFTELSRGVEQELRHVKFQYSFRSGPNVLNAVDAVFARPQALRGLSADEVKPVHQPLPDALPGLVELWPLIKADPKNEIEAWDAPFDELTETSPQVRLAAKIARHVRHWQQQGVRAGDVLVLVRQRGPLFEAIIRALKDARVDVAGADRLVLTEHIAVMDLMVLADALLLPEDDLALATVLKSPLFGLDDDDLFRLAWQRQGSLRGALRSHAADDARLAEADAKLDRFAGWARRDSPFGFYARVLGPEQGRRRFFARLGHEADDALSEFLSLALDYEARETPSLQGFIAWLRS
ncbi:MAG: double-strand break repair helicase AddA, partial [Pseudolabrys sp.]